eukprot:6896207-Lingulodinium_polyedra.AAC.1
MACPLPAAFARARACRKSSANTRQRPCSTPPYPASIPPTPKQHLASTPSAFARTRASPR